MTVIHLPSTYDELASAYAAQTISLKLASAQLAATEEALAQVQRESAELRQKYETEAYRVMVVADTAWESRYEAARKVADAAVRYWKSDNEEIEFDPQAFSALDDAVREYRALAELPASNENADGMGFYPGFPPGFDVKQAEKGLAQKGIAAKQNLPNFE